MFPQSNNNAFFNNNMVNNKFQFNNINNNMPIMPQPMNNRNIMMNDNQLLSQNKDTLTQTLKRDLKLNKIIEIGSMIPLNNCEDIWDIYTDKEYNEITQVCVNAIREKVENISKYCAEKIKEKLKGQWFVLVSEDTDINFEFGFTKINFKNILSFQYNNKIFYISCLNRKK